MNVIKQKLPIVSSDPIDGSPVAIYIHGLASVTAGTTFCSLARKYKHYRWITTDFPETIENNVNLLNSLIAQERPALIVGTSMGGLRCSMLMLLMS